MSYSQSKTHQLTDVEWKELVALKEAINENPASVHPDKMELFTELLVRSWSTECEPHDTTKWRTGHPMDD
jgi:hypothetical protein